MNKNVIKYFLLTLILPMNFVWANDPCENLNGQNTLVNEHYCIEVFNSDPLNKKDVSPFKGISSELGESAYLTSIIKKRARLAQVSGKLAASKLSNLNVESKEVAALKHLVNILNELEYSDHAKNLKVCEENNCSYGKTLSDKLIDEVARHETPGRKCVRLNCGIKTYMNHFKAVAVIQSQKAAHLVAHPYLSNSDIFDYLEDELEDSKQRIEVSDDKSLSLLKKSFEGNISDQNEKIKNTIDTLNGSGVLFNKVKASKSNKKKTYFSKGERRINRGNSKRVSQASRDKINILKANDNVYDGHLSELVAYMSTASPQEEFDKYGISYCKTRDKIKIVQNRNGNIKLAADIGLMVAPMLLGGPAVKGALGASRVVKVMQLGYKGVSVSKMGAFAMGEGVLVGVDVSMLKAKANECSTLQVSFSTNPTEDSLKAVESCRQEYSNELNQTILMGAAGVAGQGLITGVKLAKKAFSTAKIINEDKIDKAKTAYKKATGKDLPEVDDKYLSLPETQNVMERARAEALKLNPNITPEQLDVYALAAAHAHKIELDEGVILSLRDGKTKGTDTYSDAGKSAKRDILEAYGVDRQTRTQYMRQGITGREAELNPTFTIHAKDPEKIERITGSTGRDLNKSANDSIRELSSDLPRLENGNVNLEKLNDEELRDFYDNVDLVDLRGSLYESKTSIDGAYEKFQRLGDDVKSSRKRGPANSGALNDEVSEFVSTPNEKFVTYKAGDEVFKVIGDESGNVKVLMSTNGGPAIEVPISDGKIKKGLNTAIGKLVSLDTNTRLGKNSDNSVAIIESAASNIQEQMRELIVESASTFQNKAERLNKKIKATEKLQSQIGNNFSKVEDKRLLNFNGEINTILND